MTAAIAILALAGGDSHSATPGDLETLRQHVLALRAELIVEEQIGRQLSEAYHTPMKD